MTDDREPKTDQEIVDDANALARELYASRGYEAPTDYRFDQATHPDEVSMWNLACIAYYHIEGTDVEEALSAIEEDDD